MDVLGYTFTLTSLLMSLFTFFHARKFFYLKPGAEKLVYLFLMILCLIFAGIKRQDLQAGLTDIYFGQAIFYGLYNTAIFAIIVYAIGTEGGTDTTTTNM